MTEDGKLMLETGNTLPAYFWAAVLTGHWTHLNRQRGLPDLQGLLWAPRPMACKISAITLAWPLRAARCSGVWPNMSRALGSAEAASS